MKKILAQLFQESAPSDKLSTPSSPSSPRSGSPVDYARDLRSFIGELRERLREILESEAPSLSKVVGGEHRLQVLRVELEDFASTLLKRIEAFGFEALIKETVTPAPFGASGSWGAFHIEIEDRKRMIECLFPEKDAPYFRFVSRFENEAAKIAALRNRIDEFIEHARSDRGRLAELEREQRKEVERAEKRQKLRIETAYATRLDHLRKAIEDTEINIREKQISIEKHEKTLFALIDSHSKDSEGSLSAGDARSEGKLREEFIRAAEKILSEVSSFHDRPKRIWKPRPLIARKPQVYDQEPFQPRVRAPINPANLRFLTRAIWGLAIGLGAILVGVVAMRHWEERSARMPQEEPLLPKAREPLKLSEHERALMAAVDISSTYLEHPLLKRYLTPKQQMRLMIADTPEKVGTAAREAIGRLNLKKIASDISAIITQTDRAIRYDAGIGGTEITMSKEALARLRGFAGETSHLGLAFNFRPGGAIREASTLDAPLVVDWESFCEAGGALKVLVKVDLPYDSNIEFQSRPIDVSDARRYFAAQGVCKVAKK